MKWRILEAGINRLREEPYVLILFGARQVGKSTLLRSAFSDADLWIDLSSPAERSAYLASPEKFEQECRALGGGKRTTVVVDEAQSVPEIFNAVQHLYDEDASRWKFVLCGSSARRLRKTGANLLPGRAIYRRLVPLTTLERPFPEGSGGETVPFETERDSSNPRFDPVSLEDRLLFGDLPGIAEAAREMKGELLRSYTQIYLEEEIRREMLVRDWGAFVRFLELSASESGSIVNMSSLSRQIGVALPTIRSYYELLEDMFIAFRIPAFSSSRRKGLCSTPRMCFMDTGVRNAAARLDFSESTIRHDAGAIFEQWVGQELIKRLHYLGRGRLFHLRTRSGTEIDYIVELDGEQMPVEVKWTDRPSGKDVRHLRTFLATAGPQARRGFVVCRCRRRMQLGENIQAIPYWEL
ncbi:ATP-binding protein [Kiritimatiella glycovorans]|uniref:ATP-binding protein n=1 Tax=Kiritimatiella glycovorans TaxID=1307763 RepID=A0A0G3EFD0_9BACT|nr:AAA family ATPase [Kiritimatiella glycovorans]AKJ65043.1 hypothetical protein L21SP4_01806 [Kiritimatiella glycovorans]